MKRCRLVVVNQNCGHECCGGSHMLSVYFAIGLGQNKASGSHRWYAVVSGWSGKIMTSMKTSIHLVAHAKSEVFVCHEL